MTGGGGTPEPLNFPKPRSRYEGLVTDPSLPGAGRAQDLKLRGCSSRHVW